MEKLRLNLKIFSALSHDIKVVEDEIESLQESLSVKESALKATLKNILVDTNPTFEKFIVDWAVENPIEAISYYIAVKNNINEVYFKNDNKHIELFEDENYDGYTCYALVNKKTFDVAKVEVSEIEAFYSNLACGEEIFIKLDFLNDYKIPLIKECGKFIHDCAWTIECKAIKHEVISDSIFKIIEKNFIINEDCSISNEDISLSKDNIGGLLEEYKSRLELTHESKGTFAIYYKSKVIGFIDLHIKETFCNENEVVITTLEILEEYRRMGYGSKVITLLQEICDAPVSGYSKPEDDAISFWSANGAEFDSCTNCDVYKDCEGDFGCDEPMDYCFYIENER